MPRQADHQTAVVAPVCWPPRLAFGQQRFHVGLYAVIVECPDRRAVVVVCIHGIGAGTVLMQDVEVE